MPIQPQHRRTAPSDSPAGRPIPEHPDAALFPIEVAYLTGRGLRTLEADRLRGGGIPFLRIGRGVRYRRRDVLGWIESRVRTSTSDPGPALVLPAGGAMPSGER
jgi:hypothetical protein